MEIKEDKNLKKLSGCKDNFAESPVDYTLPDYLGDVRKILYTECLSGAFGKFSSEGREELSGSVNWNVLYLDSDGNPASASFNSDYEMTVKRSEDCRSVFAFPSVSAYTLRLVGPRKFSGKAEINLSTKVLTDEDVSPMGTAFEKGDEVETDSINVSAVTMASSAICESEYAEMIVKLEGAIRDEVSVFCPDASVRFASATLSDDRVCLKGEILLRAIINESGIPMYLCEKAIPIEEQVSAGDIKEGMIITPHASVCSLVTNINATDEGTEVVMSVIVEYRADGECNETVQVITDAYLKNNQTENTYEDYRYTTLLDKIAVCDSMSCEFPLNTICTEVVREIYCLDSSLKIENTEISGDTLAINGEVKLSGFATATDESGSVIYLPLKLISPMEIKIKCPRGMSEDTVTELLLTAVSPSAIIDGDNAIFTYKVTGTASLYTPNCVRLLKCSDISESGEVCRKKGRITVYYPESGETLFSVAKKFHTSSVTVAKDNDLAVSVGQTGDKDVLADVKFLLIRGD